MPDIRFSKEEQELLTEKILRYCKEELDLDLGRFDAQFLLEFFTREIGPCFYNRALYDARAILQVRLDDIAGAIDELEKTTDVQK